MSEVGIDDLRYVNEIRRCPKDGTLWAKGLRSNGREGDQRSLEPRPAQPKPCRPRGLFPRGLERLLRVSSEGDGSVPALEFTLATYRKSGG